MSVCSRILATDKNNLIEGIHEAIMPKSLSLKKAQAGPPKNQKPITHFFKKSDDNTLHLVLKKPEHIAEPLKRKAISPIETDLKLVRFQEKVQNSPKKYKSEKLSKYDENFLEASINYEENSSSEIIQQTKRSPLTPVPTENFIKNVDDNHNNHDVEFLNKQYCNKNDNHVVQSSKNLNTPNKRDIQNSTPKKSSGNKVINSPKLAKFTPEKTSTVERTPSKNGSTVKMLDFSEEEDMFGDDWQVDEIEEFSENLDLSVVQRCEVLSVVLSHHNRLELKLKSSGNKEGTCVVEGIWADTPLLAGDVICITATRSASGQWSVSNTAGLLVLHPDHLISATSVAGAVFCKRKAVLQERWRGIDSANSAMTIGILIHELVQKALTQDIRMTDQLRAEAEQLLKNSIQMLYDAGLCEEEARSSMETYVQPLADFMKLYMRDQGSQVMPQKVQWTGHIDKVLDIEENLCCPQLGLKGKIDATLEVTIHERREKQRCVVPLELKSGKASMSAEHRGQLVLYGMMLSALKRSQPTTDMQRGLLLYLRDRVDLREVSCGYPERRDLIMLRNELVSYLAQESQQVDPEQLTDIEDAVSLLHQRLPEPINHETACTKCPYVTLCSLHLWHTEGLTVSPTHPLSKLKGQAIGHLTPTHIKYFLHWTTLLKMEERGQMIASPLHALWTDSVEKRTKRGTCASELTLSQVDAMGDRFNHIFVRKNTGTSTKGPQEGEFSIVSIEHRPWIAAGVVSLTNDKELHILLERDLSRRQNKDTLYHIDTYESYATTVQNLTNLGVLIEDSDRALRLRNLIIDKDPPEFEKKLPRDVGKLGVKMMRSLNIQQQRAVLKAIAAKDYALLQGLPGTGKTQTISVLIQMLVALKQRVLVTAHTHSAVDTVLARLPDTLRIMRLGSTGRVAPVLLDRCEQKLVASCDNPQQLAKLYESMEVVGVTCLGAAHAMLARTTFDVCIVDEATQVLQCTVLRPLFACKRFLLVGDPEQLPPVVRSRAARRLGMEESLFHRLMSSEATSTLQLQYRMNQPLADLVNRVAYSNQLKCASDSVAGATVQVDMKKISSFTTSPWLIKACSPATDDAAIFIDMKLLESTVTASKTLENVNEAYVVMVLVTAFIKSGVKCSDIGVIAPYRDQVSLLRRMLSSQSVEASTVDQFQGRDKSVIIYSCTRWDVKDDKKAKEGEVLNDQRRLAVSVTRAKHKLVVVGHSKALRRYEPVHRLIQECSIVDLTDEDWRLIQKYKEVT